MGTDTPMNESTKTLTLMSSMAMMLQSCNKEPELFDVTYWYLPRLFPDLPGSIYLLNETNGNLEPVFDWGENKPGVRKYPDIRTCRVFQGGAFAGTQEDVEVCRNCTKAAYCLPFRSNGNTFGMLCLGEAGKAVPEDFRGLAFVTAEYLTLSVSNLRLRQRLYDMTIRDPLTKLYNRRHMDDILTREISRAVRTGAKLGIVMIDLDHFKRLNDTFGHDAGDEVLKTVAKALESGLRIEDTVCRFGGEEFFALLTGGELKDYTARARDINRRIAALDISWKGERISPVTASLGVAAFPDHGKTPMDLIRAADQALYKAKENGRNRAMAAS